MKTGLVDVKNSIVVRGRGPFFQAILLVFYECQKRIQGLPVGAWPYPMGFDLKMSLIHVTHNQIVQQNDWSMM